MAEVAIARRAEVAIAKRAEARTPDATILGERPLDSPFVRFVRAETGQDVNACFQCNKCTAGCPVAFAMDYTPAQIMHAVRLDLEDLVLGSKTIWLCASCETCTTRCPRDLDIAGVMDAARNLAFRRKRKAAVPSVLAFFKSMRENIGMFGRSFELGMLMVLKLRTFQFFKDMGLGMKLMKKGKIKFFPSFIRVWETRRIFKRVRQRERLGLPRK